jgi:hypothetical protein
MTATFDAVFAVFVLAMLVVAVLIVRSALRRDRTARGRGRAEDGGKGTRGLNAL